MKVYKEICDSYDFDFWSGARSTVATLTDEEVQFIFNELEEIYPEGMSETELNDFFWFETDSIAEWLGWPDYETLYSARSNGKWFDSFGEWEEVQEEEEEEEDCCGDCVHCWNYDCGLNENEDC